jgi:hypothetical protein
MLTDRGIRTAILNVIFAYKSSIQNYFSFQNIVVVQQTDKIKT